MPRSSPYTMREGSGVLTEVTRVLQRFGMCKRKGDLWYLFVKFGRKWFCSLCPKKPRWNKPAPRAC